jgi:tetratricopeptide (TPR) repeat protein
MKKALTRAVLSTLLIAGTASAQRAAPTEPLLRSAPPVVTRSACSALPAAAAPTADRRRQALDLAQRGQQAAILGDRTGARDLLRRAAALDPANGDLAYQLARAEESAGTDAEAARAYCRFITLAPDAPEGADARTRLAQLMVSSRHADSTHAAAAFARGLAAYQRGQLDSADVAFTAALALSPDWPSAYYDRAVVRTALGRRNEAASDFQQYLRLEPDATNRTRLSSRIASLQDAPLSPARALAIGLVIPGGGQFYTGRNLRGALTLLGTGAALACGMRQSTSTEEVQQSATDPFGNPYTYTTTRRVTDRPCRTPGFTAAGLIAIVSAIDAYRFAHH